MFCFVLFSFFELICRFENTRICETCIVNPAIGSCHIFVSYSFYHSFSLILYIFSYFVQAF